MFTFNVTHQNVSLHLTILSAHVLSDKKKKKHFQSHFCKYSKSCIFCMTLCLLAVFFCVGALLCFLVYYVPQLLIRGIS